MKIGRLSMLIWLLPLVLAVMAASLSFIACATTQLLANNWRIEKPELMEDSGGMVSPADNPEQGLDDGPKPQPDWVKKMQNTKSRDTEEYRIISVIITETFSNEQAAINAAEMQAQTEFSRYIHTEINEVIKIYEKGTEETANKAATAEVSFESRLEASTKTALSGLEPVRYYWELRKPRKKPPHYYIWAEYCMPHKSIEEAKEIAQTNQFEQVARDKIAQNNRAFFEKLKRQFAASDGVEVFFKKIENKEISFELDSSQYQNRYSELVTIHSQLQTLETLKGNQDYIAFESQTRRMIAEYDPTEKMLMPRETLYRQQLIDMKARYEKEIAVLEERSRTLEGEKNDVLALFDNLPDRLRQVQESDIQQFDMKAQYEKEIAILEERNHTLEGEKNDVLALFDNLSDRLQPVQGNDIKQFDIQTRYEHAFSEMRARYEKEIARLEERSKTLEGEKNDVLGLFSNLSDQLLQTQENDIKQFDTYIDIISSWPVPSERELSKVRTYMVKDGDTLVKIARQQYGSALYYFWVYRCNRNVILNPDVVRTGTTLRLPAPPGSLSPVLVAQ